MHVGQEMRDKHAEDPRAGMTCVHAKEQLRSGHIRQAYNAEHTYKADI